MPFFKKKPTQKVKIKKRKNDKSGCGKEEKEGRLAVDVYQTDTEIVVIAPISHVKEDDIDIYVERSTVAISGKREMPDDEKKVDDFLHQECHWGKFSREIVLPEEVNSYQAKASFDNGILRLALPKMSITQRRKIAINEKK